MANQTDLFEQYEADEWFKRNRKRLGKEAFDGANFACQALRAYRKDISKILEIGCSNGVQLEYLSDFFSAEGFGIDPSQTAVDDGNHRVGRDNKLVKLQKGSSRDLPFANGTFNLVIAGFFLYVTDRSDVLRSLTEIDRVLAPGGFLLVRDFEPEVPHARDYSHHPGIRSYKNTYSRFFTSLSEYVLFGLAPLNRSGQLGFEVQEDLRESMSLLWKKPNPYKIPSD